MIDQITLTEGGAHIDYRVKDADPRFPPDGPPEGAGLIKRGWAACAEVGPGSLHVIQLNRDGGRRA